MASAPSFKELAKAINDFIPNAHNPLPDDLSDRIDAYLRKHEGKHEDSVADKVHDELLGIFHREISGHPPRYTTFLSILRRFRPIIGQPVKVAQWFEQLLPILDHLNQEKGLATESLGVVLDILTADDGVDPSKPTEGAALPLAERLLTLWIEDLELAGHAEDTLRNFKEKQFRYALISYGKKHPRDFMSLIDKFLVKKTHRSRALAIMAEFVRSQPPRMFLVLETSLFAHLITCLQQDTSTTIVSLALTILTMILPSKPNSLVPQLPALFNIYVRVLFWEREISAFLDGESSRVRRMSPNAPNWESVDYCSDYEGTSIPHLLDYFTILYGLYPINFMDYIRKPQRYLRHAEVEDADDIEVQPTEIRHASEQFRQCHLLHENFYTLTIESEKTDLSRWSDSESTEVIANCVALCQYPEDQPARIFSDSGTGIHELSSNEADKDGPDSALLSRSFSFGPSSFGGLQSELRRNQSSATLDLDKTSAMVMRQPSQSSRHSNMDSMSTRRSGTGAESPTTSRPLTTSGSQTHLQDMIHSNKVIKSGLHQTLTNDSVPSLSLSHPESVVERPQPQVSLNAPLGNPILSAGDEGANGQQAHLYRQILLLQNDLTFERFMKQQHLARIGELRRKQVDIATSEAEAQNLLLANRQLKQRLEDARKSELQVKKESENRRTMAKKWEADLTTKLRVLREERKKWITEGTTLRSDLEAAKADADRLVKLVCEAEVRELGLKQKMQAVEINNNEMKRLEKEVEQLTETERYFQGQQLERQEAITRASEADNRVAKLEMKLQAREVELGQAHDIYKSQIAVLNEKLQEALKKGTVPKSTDMTIKMEGVLADSRAQQAELRKRVADLNGKNTALQAKILELESTREQPAERTRSDSHQFAMSGSDDDDDEESSESESEFSARNRRHRGLSDPENLEPTSYNATPPLEPFKPSTPSNSPAPRPSTPQSLAASSVARVSPTNERYYGRGGAQNSRLLKDKKEEKDKKERKLGMRGLRGFG